MSQSGIYSELKPVWWYARDGGLPDAPKQVQLILSDLCNQDCSFCLAKNTIVDTERGMRYIQDIVAGDLVYGPTGALNEVTQTSSRVVETVVEVSVAGRTVKATPEHPILTNRGWIQAGDLRVGDAAIVRVRLRQPSDRASRTLESVCADASNARQEVNVTRSAQTTQRTHEIEQPDAQAGGGEPRLSLNAREGKNALSGMGQECCRGGAPKDAIGSQSNEATRGASGCDGEDSIAAEVEERDYIRAVARGEQSTSSTNRRRHAMDWEAEPGLSCCRSEEVGRTDDEGMFHRSQEDSHARWLWNGEHPTLPQQGVGVSSRVQKGPQTESTCGIAGCTAELHVAGICLERGLAFRQIDSIRRLSGSFTVYNFSCSPEEAFEADWVVVHNCAYRMSGYTSNELFVGESEQAAYGHNNPKRWIPTERALRLIDEFKEAGVLSVQFTGGGEPTVHPEHERVFEKALGLGLRCSLVSNGVKWNFNLMDSILPRFDWVRVSIDAGNAESYAKIRRTPLAHWDRVWQNVSCLASTIALNSSTTALGVGFVVTPDSWSEIPEFARIAKEHGAHNVRFSAMFSPQDEAPFVPIYDSVRVLIDKTRAELQDESFTIHDNFGSRFDDLRQRAPDYSFCSYQYYTAYVGGDMKAYRCCVLAYNKRGLISGGDLKERSFAEFWKSEERKNDQAALDARGCERCQFNSKNRALLYVMGNTESDTTPRHIEWT